MPTKLGQNFLTNDSIAQRIVTSANLSKNDNILEIGPGKGVLTEYMAGSNAHVLAIEIDQRLIEHLEKIFHVETRQCLVSTDSDSRVKIINGDILKINLPRLIEENNFQNYKIVANLPYYITSKIIRLFLETKYPPREMTLMVQREVGERIVAQDEKESILSISVKFYADPEILFEVGKENFDPVPKVDSAVIRITRKKNPPKADASEFFSLVKTGFSAKRKMLVNNLANLGHPRAELLEILKKAGLEPTVRAEKLTVEDWVKLCNSFLLK